MSASSRQERAFDVYLSLGPDRSLAELAAVLRADPHRAGLRRAPSLRTVEGWSAGRKWQDRIADIDRQAREEADRQHIAWVSEHRERLRQEGLLLQQRGIEWLEAKDGYEVKANEAIRAIEAGFKLEALAHPRAQRRPLHGARRQHTAVTLAVAVLERPLHHVRYAFDIAVRVHGPGDARAKGIVVEHAQGTEPHVLGVVVLVEREMPVGGEPAALLVVYLISTPYLDQSSSLRLRSTPFA